VLTNADIRVREHVNAQDLTTFAIGGKVAKVAEPKTLNALVNLVKECASNDTAWRILGNGSNVVIDDNGLSGLLLHLGKEFSKFYFFEHSVELNKLDEIFTQPSATEFSSSSSKLRLFAFAGTPLMSLSRKVSGLGFSGLEFAAGIPGSIGGAVKMNAGAHGQQLSDILENVIVLNQEGQFLRLEASELGFSYRHSKIEANQIVVAAEFALELGQTEEIIRRRTECLGYRKKTQPLHLPSAGSVFKNIVASNSLASDHDASPVRAAGELLEQVGCKGMRHGGVMFSELHANWLVKIDSNATSADFDYLINEARNRVRSEFGLELESEIIRW